MPERVLTRVHSLRERLDSTLVTHRNEILMVLSRYHLYIYLLCIINYDLRYIK
jgi:hypothetical protein